MSNLRRQNSGKNLTKLREIFREYKKKYGGRESLNIRLAEPLAKELRKFTLSSIDPYELTGKVVMLVAGKL